MWNKKVLVKMFHAIGFINYAICLYYDQMYIEFPEPYKKLLIACNAPMKGHTVFLTVLNIVSNFEK